jgi:hypothetical protein
MALWRGVDAVEVSQRRLSTYGRYLMIHFVNSNLLYVSLEPEYSVDRRGECLFCAAVERRDHKGRNQWSPQSPWPQPGPLESLRCSLEAGFPRDQVAPRLHDVPLPPRRVVAEAEAEAEAAATTCTKILPAPQPACFHWRPWIALLSRARTVERMAATHQLFSACDLSERRDSSQPPACWPR